MIKINKYDTIGDLCDTLATNIVDNYNNYIIRINYDLDKIKKL